MIKKHGPYWVIAAIFLAVPVLIVLTSGNFNYCIDHQGQYPTAQGEHDQSSALPITSKVAIFINCLGSYANANGVAITAIATLLLTFVTAGLVYTAYRQIVTARIQLKAYVFPVVAGLYDGATLNPPRPDRINYPGIFMEWQNTGQTPASRVISWAKIEVIEPINEDKLVVPNLQNVHSTTLGAGIRSNKSLWFERPLSASEIDDIIKEVKGIYLYGRIEYYDIFNEPRFTNFRFVYMGNYPPIGSGIFLHCKVGNDAE